MELATINILYITGEPEVARQLETSLAAVRSATSSAAQYRVLHEPALSGVSRRLEQGGVEVILLDLALPSGDGDEALGRLRAEYPALPLVVVAPPGDEARATRAIQHGAHDYLPHGQLDGELIARVLRYALERHRLQEMLRQLSLTDDLTGTYNRRGFLTLAEHHVKLLPRTRGLLLVVARVEDLNLLGSGSDGRDRERLLLGAAEVLNATFRASDIIARVEDDEFAVLALDSSADVIEIFGPRLQQNVEARNAAAGGPKLTLTVGMLPAEPRQRISVHELLARAHRVRFEAARKRAF
ncbi:MAG TPA: diguanylate cyclase [Gemmatimonadaceae bacterium]|nr:diguanylate cyclase [Gemmatimonadaceae bacterium]